MVVQLVTPITKKKILYSDFFKDLTQNPLSLDLAVKINEESVKESIKNLILTDRGERLFQPSLGSDVKASLFELNTPVGIKILQEKIRAVLVNYEPRAEIIDIRIDSKIDDNSVRIEIFFAVQNKEEPIAVTVFIERTR